MQRSKQEGIEYRSVRRARWFGSFRVLPDERLSYSPWSYLDAPFLALNVASDRVTVVGGDLEVMYLYLERNRIASACFLATLTADELRTAVATLRNAAPGLNSWVIPALEFSLAWRSVREDPEKSRFILDLLESCRDLPVAKRWQRIRTLYFTNFGIVPPEVGDQTTAPRRKPPRKVTKARKATPQR